MLLELARSGDGPVAVRVLAERQGVPRSFARSVQRDLAQAGIVTTVRGARGGIMLARPAKEVTLYDVIVATQGRASIAVCANDPTWCEFADGCAVHEVWCEADGLLREFLGTKTLASLSRAKGSEVRGWM
jgi:Rrf2 family protein